MQRVETVISSKTSNAARHCYNGDPAVRPREVLGNTFVRRNCDNVRVEQKEEEEEAAGEVGQISPAARNLHGSLREQRVDLHGSETEFAGR